MPSRAVPPPFSGREQGTALRLSLLPCAAIIPNVALPCKLGSSLLPALPSRPVFCTANSQIAEAAPALAQTVSPAVLSLGLYV